MSRDITDRFVGADWYIDFVISGVPDNVNIVSAQFVLKLRYTDTDASALITRSITTIASASGQITETAPPLTVATLTFLVPNTMTGRDILEPKREYYYRVPIISNDGVSDFDEIAEDGKFIPQ